MGSPTPMLSTPGTESIWNAALAASSAKASFPKSDVNITLNDHYNSKVYTSSSPVSGEVAITTRRHVPFDRIQVFLLGTTKASFESSAGAFRSVTHTFLKMMMPIPESTYPSPRVLQPGQTYTIPFNFVIPSQLTINACDHQRLSDQVQDHHLLLPPTMGGWQRDDLSPSTARVQYNIVARVVRDDVVDGVAKPIRIVEATRDIQVLPASHEEPPLNITDKDTLYRMSRTKTLRRNLFSSKLGRVTAEAVQPSAAVLSSDGRRVMSHPVARVKLTYEPASSSSSPSIPPTITAVSSKLTAHTYFSSGTITTFPNLGDWSAEPLVCDRRGHYASSVALPAVTLGEQPAWTTTPPPPTTTTTTTTTTPEPLVRQDSGYCGSSSESESDNTKKKSNNNTNKGTIKTPPSATTTTTTTLTIPLALPTDRKTFLPSFHSCIASRVYTLQLTLRLSAPTFTSGGGGGGGGGASTSVSLVVPLQVAVEGFGAGTGGGGGDDGGDGVPSFEEEAEADEHLRPRVLRVPVDSGEEGGFVSGGSAGRILGARGAGRGGGEAEGGDEDEEELPGYGS
ncbi:hypothetical protein VTK26DRAFT_8221 [Humicola hyalothermophila]